MSLRTTITDGIRAWSSNSRLCLHPRKRATCGRLILRKRKRINSRCTSSTGRTAQRTRISLSPAGNHLPQNHSSVQINCLKIQRRSQLPLHLVGMRTKNLKMLRNNSPTQAVGWTRRAAHANNGGHGKIGEKR